MKAVRIDFSPPSLTRSLLHTGRWAWLSAMAGLAVCIGAAISADGLLTERAAAEAELQSLRTALEQRAANTPLPKKIAIGHAQASAVNAAVAQLNLPWRDVLDAVEEGTPTTIALLGLDPDEKKQLVRGVAEAKTSDDMVGYIERLKRQPFFHSVVLTRHEINEQDPNKPLRFQLEAHWVEAAP